MPGAERFPFETGASERGIALPALYRMAPPRTRIFMELGDRSLRRRAPDQDCRTRRRGNGWVLPVPGNHGFCY